MQVSGRNDAVQLTTAGTVAGAAGGALGALAGSAAVWSVLQTSTDTDPSAVYPLAGVPGIMALVVAGVVATVVGILVGLALGMAFSALSWDLLGRRGLVLLAMGCLVAEALVLLGLRGLTGGREVGLTDFLWTAVLPGMCASPLPALAAMALALVARHRAEPTTRPR
jgi:hypothetical protein